MSCGPVRIKVWVAVMLMTCDDKNVDVTMDSSQTRLPPTWFPLRANGSFSAISSDDDGKDAMDDVACKSYVVPQIPTETFGSFGSSSIAITFIDQERRKL